MFMEDGLIIGTLKTRYIHQEKNINPLKLRGNYMNHLL
jgi:hypothetical protein